MKISPESYIAMSNDKSCGSLLKEHGYLYFKTKWIGLYAILPQEVRYQMDLQ